jgi:hypothetical protein
MSLDPIETDNATFIRRDLDAVGFNPRARQALETLPLDRDVLTEAVNDTRTEVNDIEGAGFALWRASTDKLSDGRMLTSSPNVTVAVDDEHITPDLTDTGVMAGAHGDAAHVIKITVDAKGRLLSVQSYPLSTDNVTEGTTNLYFTQSRARQSISAGSGISYDSSTGVISANPSGFTGTVTPVTSITVANGLVTAVS